MKALLAGGLVLAVSVAALMTGGVWRPWRPVVRHLHRWSGRLLDHWGA